jgi:hypothetical protein
MGVDVILRKSSIPNPCPMDWDRMAGDERVRFCAWCGKHVYNLTAMSPDETASLISTVHELGERRCVRLYQRPDGTLFASECRPASHGTAMPWQFTIRFLMAIIAGCAAVLGLTRWISWELKTAKPPPAANSQIIVGDMY